MDNFMGGGPSSGENNNNETNSSSPNTPVQSGFPKKRKTTTASFLSEEEKKARHIASEKKRREAIRQAFDRIVDLVPNLTPAESRTEVAVLTKSASFIDKLRTDNLRLVELLRENNIDIPKEVIQAFQKTQGDPNKDHDQDEDSGFE